MSVSLDPSVRYVTQSGLFDVLRLGPLTDKQIERYQREGKYGELARLRALAKTKRKKQRSKSQVMKKFNKLFANI